MQPSMLAKRGWILLFAAISAFYFFGLGLIPLVGPDEPRYAQIAREMFGRADLITPTLAGRPWFEKPPLLYWLMMASYRMFGVSEYAARFGSALCGLASALLVYWVGRSVERSDRGAETVDLGRWSALVLLSSAGVIGFARGASFDIVLMTAEAGVLSSFLIWQIRYGKDSVTRPREYLVLGSFYLFMGLSLLSKGLVGLVLASGVIGLYFLLRREWPGWKLFKSLIWGIPIVILSAGLWYGPMIQRHGWHFINDFIIQHHFARFATNKFHHPAPFYFYLPVLIALALPWTVVLIAGLWSARRWTRRSDRPIDHLRVFALAWIVVPVVFFSFSASKLTAYILPVMPGVALLVGERLACFLSMKRGEKAIRLTGTLMILVAAAGCWYATRIPGIGLPMILIAAAPVVLAGMAALIAPHLQRAVLLAIALAMIGSSVLIVARLAPPAARSESVRDLLSVAETRGYNDTAIVQLHTIERTAEFYAAGRISYRSDGEPVKLEGASQVADAARQNGGVILCIVPLEYAGQLSAERKIEAEEIGRNGAVGLFVVRLR